MSSSGNLATANYTNQAVAMADANPDFVIGFIAMQRLSGVRDYLVLTPGVALGVAGDAMGQQYRTPSQVIRDSGCDVIIVGRGIYEGDGGNDGVVKRAEMYRREGWNAYLERIA
ncbi:orotidine 5'-phosphate decarboxylase, partial [Nowakowskiella sp. JEL0078]